MAQSLIFFFFLVLSLSPKINVELWFLPNYGILKKMTIASLLFLFKK